MATVRQHRDMLPGGGDRIIYQRGYCAWVLHSSMQGELDKRVNPRSLPVVQRPPESEDFLLRLAIRRLRQGYFVPNTRLPRNAL